MSKTRWSLGLAALVTGLVLWRFGVAVHPGFFAVTLAWLVGSAIVLGRLAPASTSVDYSRFRLFVFLFEVGAAALASRFLGIGGLVAVPLLLAPALDWTLATPGPRAIAGAAVAGLAAGAVVFFDPTAPGVNGTGDGAVVAALMSGLAAVSVTGLATWAGLTAAGERRRATALRRRVEELETDNVRIRDASEGLRDAHREVEAANQELRRAQADLVNSAKLATLGTLVAGVAHELNTPLGAIHSNHDVIHRALVKLQDILADEVVTPDELDEVRRIVVAVDGVLQTNGIAVDRMVGLVTSLRDFGRPDRADVDVIDLHEGLEGTLALVAHELRDHIKLERDYGKLPPIECYPNRLNQVFMNLLLNASQAIEGAGTISIRTRPEGDEVAVEIRDTGPGMPAETLAHIFEPGFTTKGTRMGMGLGLAICRQIVDQHGGRISADSVVGEGTTFTVRLPTRLAGQVAEPAPVGADLSTGDST